MSSAVKVSCTSQAPAQVTIFFFVFFAVFLARYWSGIMMTVSPSTASTIWSALDEVQHTSVTALTAAEELT